MKFGSRVITLPKLSLRFKAHSSLKQILFSKQLQFCDWENLVSAVLLRSYGPREAVISDFYLFSKSI